jgi:hypothetical protein
MQSVEVDLGWRRRSQTRVELPWPQDLHSAGGEGSADQRPVGLDEAEDAGDRNVVTDDGTHEADLLKDAVDELGAIPATEEQLLGARTEEATLDLERRTAPVALRVDDVDAGRRDSDVVDVGAGAGDAAVVEYSECVGGELVELLASRSSPMAPVSQAFVDCGSSVTARKKPPSFGCFSRIRASRLACRRSYSRRAEAPGVPGAMSSVCGFEARCARTSTTEELGEQSRQRTVLVERS